MLSMLEEIFRILTCGEFIVGLLGNGFIGFTNFTAWIKKKKLYVVDYILTSLAWARLSQLCLIQVNIWSVQFSLELLNIFIYDKILTNIWSLNNHLCTWISTCLAVFYFLKIANFSHPLFLCLNQRINKVIFMLLVVSVPFLFMTFPFPFSVHNFCHQVYIKSERNMTGLNHESINNILNYMSAFLIASLLPFCISSISFFLLLLSLWRHTKHIELNIRGPRDPSLEVHYRAMKSMFFSLVFFVLFHVGILLILGTFYFQYNKLIVMFGYALVLLYPTAHSYVVIFGNSQMKKTFLGIFGIGNIA